LPFGDISAAEFGIFWDFLAPLRHVLACRRLLSIEIDAGQRHYCLPMLCTD